MFMRFFTELRQAKVQVTLKEYLMLMEGLDKGVIDRSAPWVSSPEQEGHGSVVHQFNAHMGPEPASFHPARVLPAAGFDEPVESGFSQLRRGRRAEARTHPGHALDLGLAVAGLEPDQRQQPAVDRADHLVVDEDPRPGDALDEADHPSIIANNPTPVGAA